MNNKKGNHHFFKIYIFRNSVIFSNWLQQQDIRINYIQLPVLFKFNITNNFAFAVGPQASLKAHEYEDGVKNFTYSGVAGVDFMITDEFFLDFRYKYGFVNLFDDELGVEAKGNTMQIGFGVKF